MRHPDPGSVLLGLLVVGLAAISIGMHLARGLDVVVWALVATTVVAVLQLRRHMRRSIQRR